MNTIYKVRSDKVVKPSDPLHVSRFFTDKTRIHRNHQAQRQDLILFLADLHAKASSKGNVRAFFPVKLSLVALRQWVYDYRVVLDYFFEIQQLGYSVNDNDFEITSLVPKKIDKHVEEQTAELDLQFVPD